jgi:hypothetical protein
MGHLHHLLGNPPISVVESVLRTNNIACARHHEPSVCDACQQAKIQQLPFDSSLHFTKTPFELSHSDVGGRLKNLLDVFVFMSTLWIISLVLVGVIFSNRSLTFNLLFIAFNLMLNDNSTSKFAYSSLTGTTNIAI